MTEMSSKKAAAYFGVTTDTLRFYEKKGVIPPVKRDKNGYRVYTDTDLDWLYFAICLKQAGLSLKKITEFAALVTDPSQQAIRAAKSLLQGQIAEIDKQVANLQAARVLLQKKLTNFDDHIGKISSNRSEIQQEWKNYQK